MLALGCTIFSVVCAAINVAVMLKLAPLFIELINVSNRLEMEIRKSNHANQRDRELSQTPPSRYWSPPP